MRRARRVAAVALLAAVVGGALAGALVLTRGDTEAAATGSPGRSGVTVHGTLSPRIVLFGDTVEAVVDVTLDRGRIDPDTVRVRAEFSPWQIVGRPERTRSDSGSATHLRTTFVLRCLTRPCIPAGQSAPLQFSPGRVLLLRTGEREAERLAFPVRWPLLVAFSRFSAVRFDDVEAGSTPWRADLDSLPAVSYRVSPGILLAFLVAASALAAAAAAALAYVAWPRRAPPPPPEPEPEPLPALSPLEQALALLEESARTDGAGEQRRALELVAEELEEWGDLELAGFARTLAWSEEEPGVEETNALAARVRNELEDAVLARAGLEQNGDGLGS